MSVPTSPSHDKSSTLIPGHHDSGISVMLLLWGGLFFWESSAMLPARTPARQSSSGLRSTEAGVACDHYSYLSHASPRNGPCQGTSIPLSQVGLPIPYQIAWCRAFHPSCGGPGSILPRCLHRESPFGCWGWKLPGAGHLQKCHSWHHCRFCSSAPAHSLRLH